MDRNRGRDNDDRGRDRDGGRGGERGGRDRGDDRGRDRGRDDSRDSRDDSRGSSRRGGGDDRSDRGGRSSGSGRNFDYQGRSSDQIKKRGQMRGKEFDRFVRDDIKTWVPADGVNIVRILPATWDKPEHYGYDLYVHYGVGPDRQSYLDLDKMQDKPDPITEERVKAKAEGDDEYAKELDSKRRCGVYIVDRKNEKEGVQFWAMPWTIDADINKVSVDRRTGEVFNIDDPVNGYDIEFEKTGTGARTKYEAVAISRRSSELGDDRWLDYAMDNPIPDILVFFDYDHIAKAFGSGSGGGGRDSGRSSSREGSDDDRGSRGRDRDGGRDSQDRDESRTRDRDRSDRNRDDGGDRGRDRDRDDRSSSRDERGGSGGRDRGAGDRSRRDEPVHSWTSIHEMTGEELEALIDEEKLEINPSKASNDEDLADWICEEMKLKKEEASSGRRRIVEEPAKEQEDDRARLRRMREERNRD